MSGDQKEQQITEFEKALERYHEKQKGIKEITLTNLQLNLQTGQKIIITIEGKTDTYIIQRKEESVNNLCGEYIKLYLEKYVEVRNE